MDEGKLVITTGVSPVTSAAKCRTVQWDLASWDDTLRQKMSTSVDLGLPRSILDSRVRGKELPQELTFSRSACGDDEYNLGFQLNNGNNIGVRYSLKVSSGAPRVERVLSDTVAVDPRYPLRVKFTLKELGLVGRNIKRTNRLRFEIELAVVSERVESKRIVSLPGPALAASIGACLESEDLLELSDVSVVDNDDGVHSAHRFLLSVRSPVFRAMFQHDMQETRTGRVQIDASADAVSRLLKFVYTDDIDNLREDEDLLMEVFGLGSLYALPRLQALAETQMKDTLTIDNVAGRLLMAVRHNSLLQTDCVSMIKSNISDVVKTEGWAEIAKDASVVASIFSCDDSEDHSSTSKDNDGRNGAKRQRSS